MTEMRALSPDRFELGEGGRWVGDQVVLVNIPAGQLFGTPAAGEGTPATNRGTPAASAGMTPAGDAVQLLKCLVTLPVPLAAVAPVRGEPGSWVAAAGTGFWVVSTGGVRELAAAVPVTAKEWRMNDAVADPAGRFWAGSMACDQSARNGALYRLDPDGRVHTVLRDLTIANGPAFTGDGRTMFLSDTPLAHVDRFDVDPATGALSGRRPFLRLDPAVGAPDGLTVDADGFLWVALFGGGAVHRYRPDGELDQVVEVPARQPTSVCLAGSRLIVTSGRGGLDDPGPDDGAVLVGDTDVKGVPALPVRRLP